MSHVKFIFLVLSFIFASTSFAEAKYEWLNSNQGVTSNLTESFAPYQIKVDHRRPQDITFTSRIINLAIRSSQGYEGFPVSILFNPVILCSINGESIKNLRSSLEINGVRYPENTSVLIDNDEFRQYRIIIKMFGVLKHQRGSVLCDIKNGLSISG